jgi:hypothetical protein
MNEAGTNHPLSLMSEYSNISDVTEENAVISIGF